MPRRMDLSRGFGLRVYQNPPDTDATIAHRAGRKNVNRVHANDPPPFMIDSSLHAAAASHPAESVEGTMMRVSNRSRMMPGHDGTVRHSLARAVRSLSRRSKAPSLSLAAALLLLAPLLACLAPSAAA